MPGYRSLYTVFIVDPRNDQVVFRGEFVAESAQAAERKALRQANDVLSDDIDEYDFVTELRGSSNSIRPKSK